MIRDTLLICSIVICLVLFYRMYVLNQKMNNLEEKVSIIDNFSQSIFNFINAKEEEKVVKKDEVKEVTYSNNVPTASKLTVIQEIETESETETEYQPEVNNEKSDDTKDTKDTNNTDSKEILSEMVAELKDSLIKTSKENLENDLNQVQELKEELNQVKETESENKSSSELFNLLNNVTTINSTTEIKMMDSTIENDQKNNSLKKKEELNNMNLMELKALAKKKNIPVMLGNKNKKKEVLIQDLLKVI
jgi:hypothetical protein